MHHETEKKLRALLASVESALIEARDVCEDELGGDEVENRGTDYVRDALAALRSGREWLLPTQEEIDEIMREDEPDADEPDESMDGDAESALESVYGPDVDCGEDW